MLKKYLPYIMLIAAALLLFFIKRNQRGSTSHRPATEQTADKITVPAILPANEKREEVEARPDDLVGRGFDRNTTNLIFSKHAKCRMDCRKIDESEIREILKSGTINYKKIQNDKRGKTYPVEGFTHDKQHVRIVFAPKDDGLVVVTVIDLDTEWKCDCK
jgi:Domain of unknown function (DUF4258)